MYSGACDITRSGAVMYSSVCDIIMTGLSSTLEPLMSQRNMVFRYSGACDITRSRAGCDVQMYL